MTLPNGKPKGRPPLPPEERRTQVSTTLPNAIADKIFIKGWKMNECLIDGVLHREKCVSRDNRLLEMAEEMQALYEKIRQLQTIIEERGNAEILDLNTKG